MRPRRHCSTPMWLANPRRRRSCCQARRTGSLRDSAQTADAVGVNLAACLPMGIREYLLHGSPEPEHRYISVAFIEFSGTDAILAQSGPAAVADAVDECISNVQQAANRYGVTFFLTDINANGGKILLVAGAPTNVGNGEERMLRTLRTIMDTGGILPLRIGMNGGYVFAAGFGPPYRRTYSVKGDAVNLAARLMAAAGRGQILATEAVLSRSPTTFETEPLEPFHVKGKREPVQAMSVGAIAGSRGVAHGETRLIGREREMAFLQEALDSARARRGMLVELIGEPGIGKSRLVGRAPGPSDRGDSAHGPLPGVRVLDALLPHPAASSGSPRRRGRNGPG